MDIKNMKVSIGIVIAIVAQAFGIIWYVAQLDSTVSNLDTSVAVMQESQATVDVAVLQTEVDNLIEEVAKFSSTISGNLNEKFRSTLINQDGIKRLRQLGSPKGI